MVHQRIVPAASSAHQTVPSVHALRGDEDDDDDSGEYLGRSTADTDADGDDDDLEMHRGYRDRDDREVLSYGHPASPRERRLIEGLVRRYYEAGAVADGATACSMMPAPFVKAVPEDYGSSAEPAYMHGTTCAVVATLFFKHFHNMVAAPFRITSVRLDGDKALVLMGSRAWVAGFLPLQREGGEWKIIGLLTEALR
jgi:hypothetical protein